MIKPSVSPDAGSEVRFQAYISALSEEIGHADRIAPLRRYCTGLLLPGERKSIEPMAARLDHGMSRQPTNQIGRAHV